MDVLRAVGELGRLRERSRRLLIVFPHPDDEAYGAAGALARTASDPEGAAALLCLTRGEASTVLRNRGLSRPEVAALRARRMEEVAQVLRLDALLLDSLPDGRMVRCSLDELAAPIRAAVDAFRPQVLVGHDPRGVNAHPDHIASHWAIRHALQSRPEIRFAMIAYPQSVCERTKPRTLYATPDSEIDAVLTLSKSEIEAKEKCLRIHEAYATLKEGSDADLVLRPPLERYDFLGEDFDPPVADLFASLP